MMTITVIQDSGDEQGGRDAMPVPVQVRVVRDIPGPSQEQHVMSVQGRLVRDVPEDVTPFDSWVRLSEAQQYVPLEPYTVMELMQLRSVNVPFRGVLNYRDVSLTDMAVCDTGLQMCRK